MGKDEYLLQPAPWSWDSGKARTAVPVNDRSSCDDPVTRYIYGTWTARDAGVKARLVSTLRILRDRQPTVLPPAHW